MAGSVSVFDMNLSRREMLALGGGVGASLAGSAPALVPPHGTEERTVVLHEVTNAAVTASPDGRRIAFDALGLLWIASIEGGSARRLTGDLDDIAQPDWSPDGTRITYQSYRGGQFHIWSIAADGGSPIQHTRGAQDDREPRWSPDGKWIAFASDRSGRYAIHLLEVATGIVRQLSRGASQDSEPAWSPDGLHIAYVADGTRLLLSNLDGDAREVARVVPSSDPFRPAALRAPAFAPDGRIAHVRLEDGQTNFVLNGDGGVMGEDFYPFRPAWLHGGEMLYGSDGGLWRRPAKGARQRIPVSFSVPVVRPQYKRRTRGRDGLSPAIGIASPMLSPDGRRIAFCALNALWLLPIGGKPERLLSDNFYKCHPAWSPDGRQLVYASDRGGTLQLWLLDLAARDAPRQLTSLPDAAQSATWSPDGRYIAFLTQTGALHMLEVATGAVRKIYDTLWEPGRPSFSADGRHIALAAFRPSSGRFREGLSEILTISLDTGEGRYAPILPGKSIGTRGDDGPVWSPDGHAMAFVFASTLWTVAVDAQGRLLAPPRQITHEVTDAISWGRDTILYLNNGRLRLVAATGGTPRTVPCDLRYARPRSRQRKVVRAGRLWDGSGTTPRPRMDVIVEDDRIAAVLPATDDAPSDADARFIDGSDLTLLPGLIDMHVHRQMQGYAFGDRMGRLLLAMGITTTRSLGGPAYHMVEDREALESGARIGPRHYGTGEAIDGSRIYYNFMRPLTEPGQLDFEMARAKALSYDLVKTYVRLPHADQARVVDAAHRLGLPVYSHYHYPALRLGLDGMEHMGATSRLGYSRTVTAQGKGYGDVNALFAAAKASRTPTLFLATVLLGEDDTLVRDPRIRALYPPWEYARLTRHAEAMRDGDRVPILNSLRNQVGQIRDMIAAGWHFIAGTDSPIDFTAVSLHCNLRAMARFGVSPREALLAATRHAGEALEQRVGRVEPGHLADMILVEGNPLTCIDDAARIVHVIAGGTAHTPESLMAPFTNIAAAKLENPILPPLAAAHQHYWWQDRHYVESGRFACCAGHMVHA